MAERARALLAALALAACGDDAGGDDSTMTTPPPATGGLTEGTGTPEPTTGQAPGETGDATAADATGDNETGDDDPTTGADDETGPPVDEPDGLFIAVGDGGRRLRSSDGQTWDGVIGSGLLDIEDEMAPPDALRALAAGDGYVIAVGGGGTYWSGNAMIMRSVDAGMTWQEDVLADSPDVPQTKLHGVAASGPTVVAVGMRGKRIRSVDAGLTFTDVSFEDQNARFLSVAAQGQTFVIAGWAEDSYDSPKTSALTVSTDGGATWSPVDESQVRLDAVVAGAGVFVALGADVCLRSADGLAWSPCGSGAAPYIGVSYTGGDFILTSAAGLTTSPDATTWSDPVMPTYGPPKLVARGNDRWVGLRWTDRGFSETLVEWMYTSQPTEPLRALVFVPNP